MLSSGSLEFTFETEWGSIDRESPFTFGNVELALVYEDSTVDFESVGAVIGGSPEEVEFMVGGTMAPGEYLYFYFGIYEEAFGPGTVYIDLFTNWGAIYYNSSSSPNDFILVAYIAGDLTFSEVETTSGAPVIGSLNGELYSW